MLVQHLSIFKRMLKITKKAGQYPAFKVVLNLFHLNILGIEFFKQFI